MWQDKLGLEEGMTVWICLLKAYKEECKPWNRWPHYDSIERQTVPFCEESIFEGCYAEVEDRGGELICW